jgi:hypothetical protein
MKRRYEEKKICEGRDVKMDIVYSYHSVDS